MKIFIDHIVLLIAAVVLLYPTTRRPLSEDDGNWFYRAFFQGRTARLNRNFHSTYGYFGIFGVSAALYRLFRGKTPSFFNYFKIVWYCFNVVAVYWLALLGSGDHGLALVASLLLLLAMALPNTLFFLTYAEHFLILPLSLSLICMHVGMSAPGNAWLYLASGLLAGWAIQIKPTALVFALAVLPCCLWAPHPWIDAPAYLAGVLTLNLLPLFLLRNDRVACTSYLLKTFGGALGLASILLERVSVRAARLLIPEIFRSGQGFTYLQGHHRVAFRDQMEAFHRFMDPSLWDLRAIVILASVQVIALFIGTVDFFSLAMTALLLVCLCMQQIQKNYYTPHFNLAWVPLCMLAAKTLSEAWPGLVSGEYAGRVAALFLAVEACRIALLVRRSFQRQAVESLAFLGPIPGALFRMSEEIGHYIREQSKPSDKLLVWGDHPTIYLHAEREAFHPDYLFLYTHVKFIHDPRELRRFLDIMRGSPPEWVVFYQYKYPDGWNMERLQQETGIPYRLVTRFQLKDWRGVAIRLAGGIGMEFPLYRRDDDRFRDILIERAAMALAKLDIGGYRGQLENIFRIFPEDEEARIRISALDHQDATPQGLRVYLEAQLAQGGPSMSSSLALRMLGDLDKAEGQLEKAASRYGMAVKELPHDFRIYNGLAEIAFSRGDLEEAVKRLEQAYRLNPYSAEILNNLGVIFASRGDHQKARASYERALKILPGYEDAVQNLAQLQRV